MGGLVGRVNIAFDSRRVADDDCIRWDVARDYRACPDHCILPDGQTGQNGGIRTYRGTFPNEGCRKFDWILTAAWKRVVGKGDVRANKYIVFQGYSIPELDTTLDSDAVTYDDLVLDEDVITYVAVFADCRTWQDVGKGPYTCSGAD